jgi:hypothetical protein
MAGPEVLSKGIASASGSPRCGLLGAEKHGNVALGTEYARKNELCDVISARSTLGGLSELYVVPQHVLPEDHM